MIDDANINFEGLHWLYCNDDYFTHYNPEDEDPSAFGNNKPKVGEIQNGSKYLIHSIQTSTYNI